MMVFMKNKKKELLWIVIQLSIGINLKVKKMYYRIITCHLVKIQIKWLILTLT
jgi:hypothetical protein